jgi:hypothetical protein
VFGKSVCFSFDDTVGLAACDSGFISKKTILFGTEVPESPEFGSIGKAKTG